MKRTSTEAHDYMLRHQGAKVEHFDVSNVMYHRFSHDGVSYTLNGENVKVMLVSSLFECFSETRTLKQHRCIYVVMIYDDIVSRLV